MSGRFRGAAWTAQSTGFSACAQAGCWFQGGWCSTMGVMVVNASDKGLAPAKADSATGSLKSLDVKAILAELVQDRFQQPGNAEAVGSNSGTLRSVEFDSYRVGIQNRKRRTTQSPRQRQRRFRSDVWSKEKAQMACCQAKIEISIFVILQAQKASLAIGLDSLPGFKIPSGISS